MISELEKDNDLLKNIIIGIEKIKGENITILDFKDKENAISNYYVLCSGGSNTQVKAISNAIERQVKTQLKESPYSTEGFEKSEWVVLDYTSIIVHVFQSKFRDFYDIESLWGDMKEFKVEELKKQKN